LKKAGVGSGKLRRASEDEDDDEHDVGVEQKGTQRDRRGHKGTTFFRFFTKASRGRFKDGEKMSKGLGKEDVDSYKSVEKAQ